MIQRLKMDIEDDVEKLANEEILYNDQKRSWWKEGYKKAKETYKYTEQDIINAIQYGIDIEAGNIKFDYKKYPDSFTQYFASLQQPKLPIAFECEIESIIRLMSADMIKIEGWVKKNNTKSTYLKPVKTTNSQGQTIWVGKYIY